jgi:hypothetical protein
MGIGVLGEIVESVVQPVVVKVNKYKLVLVITQVLKILVDFAQVKHFKL